MTIKNIITTDLDKDFYPMGFYLGDLNWSRDSETNFIAYFLNDEKLWVDKGNSYEFEPFISDDALLLGLTLARGKFGKKLVATGDEDFLQQIAYVVAKSKIDVELLNKDLVTLIENIKKDVGKINAMSSDDKAIIELLKKKELAEKVLVPNGIYAGEVLLISKDKIVHKISFKEAVIHDKEAVLEEMPSLEAGDRIEVRYRGGRISNVTFIRSKNRKVDYRGSLGRG